MSNHENFWAAEANNFACSEDEYLIVYDKVESAQGRMYPDVMSWIDSQYEKSPIGYATPMQLIKMLIMNGADTAIQKYKYSLAEQPLQQVMNKLWVEVQPQNKEQEEYIDYMTSAMGATKREITFAKIYAHKHYEDIFGDSPEFAPNIIKSKQSNRRKLTIQIELEAVDRWLNPSQYDYDTRPSKLHIVEWMLEQSGTEITVSTFKDMVSRHKKLLTI